jgi:hypothetical protein
MQTRRGFKQIRVFQMWTRKQVGEMAFEATKFQLTRWWAGILASERGTARTRHPRNHFARNVILLF